MKHYFKTSPIIKSEEKTIKYSTNEKTYLFKTNSGLFAKDKVDYASTILINNIDTTKTYENILDLGCGYGYIGIVLSRILKYKEITFLDINEKAIHYTLENINSNNVLNAKTIVSDGIDLDNTFDLITLNPPIHVGKEKMFSLYDEALKHLNEDGILCIVIQKKHGALSTIDYLESLKSCVKIIYKKKGFYVIAVTK